jgi:hypothetical protein
MDSRPHPVIFLLLLVSGWVHRQQMAVIDYLLEENRVLRAAHASRRVRLTHDQRRRLAVKGALHANGGRLTRLFEPSPDPVGFPAGIRVDCGLLVVPENRRDNGEGRFWSSHKKIRSAVEIARVSSGVALPDPIVFVQGGPSAAAIAPATSPFSPACSAPTAT